MKILYDHQIFASQTYGGVSRYFAEVIRRLPASSWEVTATLSNNHYARRYGVVHCHTFLPDIDFRHKGRLMAEAGKPYSALRLRYGQYDIYHPTNFDSFGLKHLGEHPMVVTYHDTNFLTSHNHNSRMARLQHRSLRRADRIIAVSENTRCDLLSHFDIAPEKVEVIYHGVSTLPSEAFATIKSPDYPYILYVGLRHAFKNFTTFAKAFALVAPRYPEVKVICTRTPFSHEELRLFHSLGISDRMKVVVADEAMLARLYTDALLFIFPSRYEGFGMPILEAMAYGTPCALADASCFPEIGGEAALYFSPDDVGDVAEKMEQLLSSPSQRRYFATLGRRRAADFTWERSAQQHLNLYASLV